MSETQIKKTKYGRVTRILHGFIVLSMVYMLLVGFFDDEFRKISSVFISIHKGLGVILVFVILIFFIWTMIEHPPAMPFKQKLWEIFVARIVQRLLLISAFFQALSGWFMSTAVGYPPVIFGWVVPAPIAKSTVAFQFFHNIHGLMGWVILACIGLHILGVIKHAMIDKVNLLKRIF
ncbi:Cytochrome b561 family protein [Piscirickettsia salmonis]|uniref:Prokaryotic cytochrome b561 family protein n=1 Tax=Piscirickettsia salmonis TaxID=1238 RepID=A0A1L6TA43_PISSA|nr:cytochrome b/b6 domain-containing protein [Piscirickettsia salmonis]AKP73362.1 cytochrome B [Piscirickettsia salmonis LF-89 = ATCC VR-1361]ALB22085.1 prokaryotic cytochrome b561 family protein [Piscirickettsia salmonis]ALY02214.1 cytochrome B [Piscirickettsia salmonis]AMA41727.1 cytochrome B [Piscirickettsia salmonis]AOS34207.1 cytochrome B [Piscirickettsia salmonis]